MKPINRLKAALFGIPLVLLLSYFLAIKKTVVLADQYGKLKGTAEQLEDIPMKLGQLAAKNKNLDSVLSRFNLQNTSVENNLVRVLNLEAQHNNIRVLAYQVPHSATLQEGTLITHDFTLTGDFIGILKTLYAIETEKAFGEIIHCTFEKPLNTRTKTLQARVLLQRFL